MADVELVIKISEEEYKRILSGDIVCYLDGAIRRGTPLPKGHGRLIDADNITSISLEDSVSHLIWIKDSEIDCKIDAPTIIDADKESD